MVAATLTGVSDRSLVLPGAPELADVLWAHCESADGVEHIRCTSRPGQVGVVLFMKADDAESAVASARSVCERIIARVPALDGWRVDSCAGVTGHL